MEIWEMEVESGHTKRLTSHPRGTWDEHAHYSPNGNKIVWISSLGLRCEVDPFVLETEFWIMDRDGSNKEQLTYFHSPGHPHYLVKELAVAGDLDWNLEGTRIMGLVITNSPETQKRGSGIVVEVNIEQGEL